MLKCKDCNNQYTPLTDRFPGLCRKCQLKRGNRFYEIMENWGGEHWRAKIMGLDKETVDEVNKNDV